MKFHWRKILLGLLLALNVGLAHALSLSDAVAKVEQETGGKVLSARTETIKDRKVHVIKVLTADGRVRTVRVQAD